MALGEPLPKQVLGHPWLLFAEDKMSKSKGNVIYADDLVKKFGVDAVRYYLLAEMPFAQDGNITYESFINKFNTDLANTLGNLVNRSIAMTNKYFGGKATKSEVEGEFDEALIKSANETISKYYELMDNYKNADACDLIMSFAKNCNKYIDETTPWALAKDEANLPRLNTVMYNLLESIRLLAFLLEPIMPDCSKNILAQLNVNDDTAEFGIINEYNVGAATPLFARLDAAKIMEEIAKEQEAQMKEAELDAANVVTKELIGIDDFMKVELMTATIKTCEPIPKAKKLLKLTLDDGSGVDRTVASGIAKWYKPEDLIGKTVIIVSNLKPAKLCGVESQGMILAADVKEDDVRVIFVDGIPAGCKIR